MSKEIVPQNQELRKAAMAMVIRGQVTRNGKDGQCFISTDDGLYLADEAACTCGTGPCAHTLAAAMYNDYRERVERLLASRSDDHPTSMFWRLRNHLPVVTDPELADKIRMTLAICQQLHREERKREINTFYSVCASSGGVMFCPVPPKKRRR